MPEAFLTLERSLAEHGYRLNEISKVFLTHKHIDHSGLAARIQAVSGATVYVHREDHRDVVEFNERYPSVHELYVQSMRVWGLPEDVIVQMAATRDMFLHLGRSVPAEALDDGEEVPIGSVTLRVIHTPGHTLGSACFLIDETLFVGDHILPDYTPNIGATDIAARGLLARYRDSLRRIRDLDGARVLPGHGREISDIAARVEEILRHHDERDGKILNILADGRPRTVYEIALALFGTLRDHHALLGSGEVQAHLELLGARGTVECLEDHRYVRG
jgi:glyoxylase-like metal-dependent hydrolase (beta-lactamase superfamily II)